MGYPELTHALYLLISVTVTIWTARALIRSGRAFLQSVFPTDTAFADAVNHLLAVGFYLVNLGYVCLAVQLGEPATTLTELLEVLAWKIGIILFALGAMHFLNLYIFSRILARARLAKAPPPFPADAQLGTA